jgi:hypothetical protein
MSPNLHEMHTLLKQFQGMNQMHDLDHCEMDFRAAAKKAYEQAKAAGSAAKAAGSAAAAKASATVNAAIAAKKQHAEEVKTEKYKETVVQEKWTKMSEADKRAVLKVAVDKMSDAEKKEFLKMPVDRIATSTLTETFFNNPKLKETLQKCIDEYEVKK